MNEKLKRWGIRLGWLDRAETIARCGIELSEPRPGLKGVFLLYGTRLREFDLVWRDLQRRYVLVLTHQWALHDHILRAYHRHRHHVDCVVSPNEESDRLLDFAPIFRSNSVDLLVDDAVWPRMDLPRDIEVMDSVSVPWILKRGWRWFEETRRYLDRRGTGRAVYKLKRLPGPKEDAECHRQFERFRMSLEADSRFELCLEMELPDLVRLYNRTRALYHPSDSEFGCRCTLEAMYCGAWPIVEPFAWTRAISTHPAVQGLVQVQNGLQTIPEEPLPEIRQWQTTLDVRTRLMEFIQRNHRINTEIKSFTLFSHVHIATPSGKETSASS